MSSVVYCNLVWRSFLATTTLKRDSKGERFRFPPGGVTRSVLSERRNRDWVDSSECRTNGPVRRPTGKMSLSEELRLFRLDEQENFEVRSYPLPPLPSFRLYGIDWVVETTKSRKPSRYYYGGRYVKRWGRDKILDRSLRRLVSEPTTPLQFNEHYWNLWMRVQNINRGIPGHCQRSIRRPVWNST